MWIVPNRTTTRTEANKPRVHGGRSPWNGPDARSPLMSVTSPLLREGMSGSGIMTSGDAVSVSRAAARVPF
jgi:hypothetical protein